MKLLEPIALIDYSTPDRQGQYPFDTWIIEPLHAITWIAHGRFGETATHNVVRRWLDCDDDTILAEVNRDEARFDMAEELLAIAIKSGAVRCVYVLDDHSAASGGTKKLIAIRPEQFEGMDFSLSWDSGFTIDIGETGAEWNDYDRMATLPENPWFLWDEIAAMRPDYALAPDAATPPAATRQAEQAPRLHHPDTPRVRDPRGKRAKPWGKLMAEVLKKTAAYGLPEAAKLQNKELGGWLVDAHQELGATPIPTLVDAGRDVRALLDGLQAIMAGAKASDLLASPADNVGGPAK